MRSHNGGYDEGYISVPCFWGTEPGSLVVELLAQHTPSASQTILDIGCGEGKNAAPFVEFGSTVVAVDCSSAAIANGKRAYPDLPIEWVNEDARCFDCGLVRYDIVISYGLFHCLNSEQEIATLIDRLQAATRPNGFHVVCVFNDRSHDLSAHPGLKPTLLPHDWYVAAYADWQLSKMSDTDLHETHPHNRVPHHHSLTRFLARKLR